ncbi:hypothetical protein ACJQWK_01090 [Exserohilum turcicum]
MPSTKTTAHHHLYCRSRSHHGKKNPPAFGPGLPRAILPQSKSDIAGAKGAHRGRHYGRRAPRPSAAYHCCPSSLRHGRRRADAQTGLRARRIFAHPNAISSSPPLFTAARHTHTHTHTTPVATRVASWVGRVFGRSRAVQFTAAHQNKRPPARPDHVHAITHPARRWSLALVLVAEARPMSTPAAHVASAYTQHRQTL